MRLMCIKMRLLKDFLATDTLRKLRKYLVFKTLQNLNLE